PRMADAFLPQPLRPAAQTQATQQQAQPLGSHERPWEEPILDESFLTNPDKIAYHYVELLRSGKSIPRSIRDLVQGYNEDMAFIKKAIDLLRIPGEDFFFVPNEIGHSILSPFIQLQDWVNTPECEDFIDQLFDNPDIAEHLKGHRGVYYSINSVVTCGNTFDNDHPSEQLASDLIRRRQAYIMSDEASMPSVDLSCMEYVVMYISAQQFNDTKYKVNLFRSEVCKLQPIFTKYPNLTLVVAYPECAKYIPSGFLLSTMMGSAPLTVRKLSVTGKNISEIVEDFCSGQRQMISVDISCLRKLKEIYKCFCQATGVRELDMQKNSEINYISSSFLAITGVTEIDLSNIAHRLTIRLLSRMDCLRILRMPSVVPYYRYQESLFSGFPSLQYILVPTQAVYDFVKTHYKGKAKICLVPSNT
ncbi:MAG: hypothetical protein Q8K36_00990, partial [Alphaproteobacteria bacterium]|nr:hypothetical protein [Alphaproteobacteria bacterium]